MKGLGIAWLASGAALTRTGLWRLRTVALAYLLPVFMIGWFGIDTPREAWGMIAWVIFACLVTFVSWFFAPVQTRHTAD